MLANSYLLELIAPLSSELAWARSMAGEVQVPLDDHVGRAVYFCGDLDPKITWVIKRILRPGDLALDVGANLGVLTLLMSKLVGLQGIVHAFEPNPALFKMLEATCLHNCISNVKLDAVALGYSTAEMELNVPNGNLGAASLIRKRGGDSQRIIVPVRRLDDIILKEQISRLALIKIDVEGFKLEVLTGAQKVLTEFRPALIFEANESSYADKTASVLKLLRGYDYQFITIPRRFIRMRTKVLDFDKPSDLRGHDIVAARKGEAFTAMCELLSAE